MYFLQFAVGNFIIIRLNSSKNIFHSHVVGAVLANNDITADEKTSVKIQFQVSEWLRHCQQNLKMNEFNDGVF